MVKKKVILDSNVFISALGWGGKAYEVLDKALSGSFRLIISNQIFKELNDVLYYPKFDFIGREEKESFLSVISETAEFIQVSNIMSQKLVDPKDNMFLECAIEIDADYLVSGDKHLLNLKKVGNTRIVSPAVFLSKFHI